MFLKQAVKCRLTYTLSRAPANNIHRSVRATSKQISETVCLTSYKSAYGRNDLINSVKTWEACWATSTASSFFDPTAIEPYDGITGANNPV